MEKKLLQYLPASQIEANQLNDRAMEGPGILDLANNIKKSNELLDPITVYKNDDGNYTILSGHRRFEAMKILGKSEIPCFIHEKPADVYEEQEILLSGNFHRSKPEDIKKELSKAAQNWEDMPDERREAFKEAIKKSFIARYQNTPKYKEDPAAFIRHNFFYKEEYIRIMTGLDYSNMTISRLLKEVAPRDDVPTVTAEEEEPEVKEKKAPKITGKKIMKEIDKLLGMIEVYEPDDAAVNSVMDEIRNDLLIVREKASEVGISL